MSTNHPYISDAVFAARRVELGEDYDPSIFYGEFDGATGGMVATGQMKASWKTLNEVREEMGLCPMDDDPPEHINCRCIP